MGNIKEVFPSVVLVQICASSFKIRGVRVRGRQKLSDSSSVAGQGVRLLNKVNKRVSIHAVLQTIINNGLEYRDAYYDPGRNIYTFVFAKEYEFEGPKEMPIFLWNILDGVFCQCISIWANPRRETEGKVYRMDCILLSYPTNRRQAQKEIILSGAEYNLINV